MALLPATAKFVAQAVGISGARQRAVIWSAFPGVETTHMVYIPFGFIMSTGVNWCCPRPCVATALRVRSGKCQLITPK